MKINFKSLEQRDQKTEFATKNTRKIHAKDTVKIMKTAIVSR